MYEQACIYKHVYTRMYIVSNQLMHVHICISDLYSTRTHTYIHTLISSYVKKYDYYIYNVVIYHNAACVYIYIGCELIYIHSHFTFFSFRTANCAYKAIDINEPIV